MCWLIDFGRRVVIRRTLTTPWKPTAQTEAADAKYMERSPQIILMLVSCHFCSDNSHSLSGSHLMDRHAARTWMVRTLLVIAPKRVIRVEAVLLRRHIEVGEGREGGE